MKTLRILSALLAGTLYLALTAPGLSAQEVRRESGWFQRFVKTGKPAATKPPGQTAGHTTGKGSGLKPAGAGGNTIIVTEERDTLAAAGGDTTVMAGLTGPIQPRSSVRMALVLPFTSAEGPDVYYTDFYSGVLMAADQYRQAGVNLTMDIWDSYRGMPSVEELQEADFCIGPVSPGGLDSLLRRDGADTLLNVISPLNPAAGNLTKKYAALISAAASTASQDQDMVSWVKEDLKAGEQLVVFYEHDSPECARDAALNRLLKAEGLTWKRFSYDILDGRELDERLDTLLACTDTVRVLIASNREPFVNDVVRNLSIVGRNGKPIVLYGGARMRRYGTIEIENLHRLNLHMSAAYFTDYEDGDIIDFLLKYRALFNSEPGDFVFQGYDLTRYFCDLVLRFGAQWKAALPVVPGQGCHTDFVFEQEGKGWCNRAIRRVIYQGDFKIRKAASAHSPARLR